VSPLHIIIALEYAVSGEPGANVPSNIWNSSAAKDVIGWLFNEGLLAESGKPTEKLQAWVKMICETPLPVNVWVRPDSPSSNGG